MEQALEIGTGERITAEGELGVTLLADLEQIGVVEVRSEPGGVAPPLHAHASHAECFFVIEGELTFRLEDRERRAEQETWVFVPAEVLHTFAVTGAGKARFLDIHVPGSGFGDFVRGLHAARNEDELRAVRAAFDQHPAPEYASGDPGLVALRRAGGAEGEKIVDQLDRRSTLLVDADELTVTEFLYGPGQRGAQLHIHHHHADAYLVYEGELTFGFRDGLRVVPEGTFLLIPPGIVHGLDNDSTANARFFNFHVPASGFADYMRGKNPGFDQHDLPDGGGDNPAAIVAVRLAQ